MRHRLPLPRQFRAVAIEEGEAIQPQTVVAGRDLAWFDGQAESTPKLPLRVSPSSAAQVEAKVVETVAIGTAIDTSKAKDRAALGDAVHACIAAHFNAKAGGIGVAAPSVILPLPIGNW